MNGCALSLCIALSLFLVSVCGHTPAYGIYKGNVKHKEYSVDVEISYGPDGIDLLMSGDYSRECSVPVLSAFKQSCKTIIEDKIPALQKKYPECLTSITQAHQQLKKQNSKDSSYCSFRKKYSDIGRCSTYHGFLLNDKVKQSECLKPLLQKIPNYQLWYSYREESIKFWMELPWIMGGGFPIGTLQRIQDIKPKVQRFKEEL
eukprot:TRINITY_DN11388_c0_g1_i1.p1 TRINITY_DN11388_c0_g1~~TRINITY_DN11388_c0_g1_i1.p1  ORF type:complete len:203 (-),score=7.15 TRINITY_DN11388_c0_g1_i1:30-638(-)